jgi:IS1 family transposase
MKNTTPEKIQQGWGDIWTWTAIDADSKLIVSYRLGQRGADTANTFMQDVASRLANRIQLTTDGHRVYADAVEGTIKLHHYRNSQPADNVEPRGGNLKNAQAMA